jgi:metal-responsive CopG/Arc/MetJ family transcriptional regulator
MSRQRVVLSIEQDLLEEAHAVAVRQHTSVNEMVRQFLKQVVRQERQRLEAWRDVQRLLDRPAVRLGESLPVRGERHER